MRHLLLLALPLAAVLPPTTIQAEVVSSAAHGFSLQIRITCPTTPAGTYHALVDQVGNWWDANHTFSGDARNLTIEACEKGWFVEKLPDGGFVRHLQVASVEPDKTIRMLGGLGPLQELGIDGALTIKLKPLEGNRTELTLLYNVSGYLAAGLDKLAGPVDQVLTLQMRRLCAYLETGTVAPAKP